MKIYHRLLNILEKKSTWFKEQGLSDIILDLLKDLTRFYDRKNDFEKSATTWFEIAEIQARNEDRKVILDSVDSFKNAGYYNLRLSNYNKANECFLNGKEIVSFKMSQSDVGWYCLKEIALDYWIPEIYRSLENRDNFISSVTEWVETAANHFQYEVKLAINRLSGFIDKLDKTIVPKPAMKIEKIKQIWTNICLTLVLERYLLDISNEEFLSYLETGYREIQLLLDFLKSYELEQLVRKTPENINNIEKHWEWLSSRVNQYREEVEKKREVFNRETNDGEL